MYRQAHRLYTYVDTSISTRFCSRIKYLIFQLLCKKEKKNMETWKLWSSVLIYHGTIFFMKISHTCFRLPKKTIFRPSFYQLTTIICVRVDCSCVCEGMKLKGKWEIFFLVVVCVYLRLVFVSLDDGGGMRNIFRRIFYFAFVFERRCNGMVMGCILKYLFIFVLFCVFIFLFLCCDVIVLFWMQSSYEKYKWMFILRIVQNFTISSFRRGRKIYFHNECASQLNNEPGMCTVCEIEEWWFQVLFVCCLVLFSYIRNLGHWRTKLWTTHKRTYNSNIVVSILG